VAGRILLEASTAYIDNHPGCFIIGIFTGENTNRITRRGSRSQLLVEEVPIVGDEMIGGAENAAGGTIVLLQFDHL